MIAMRYPSEPISAEREKKEEGKAYPSMSDQIVRQLWNFLDSTGSDLRFQSYCEKMEKFINQEETGLKKFVFEIYDTMNNDQITDESLFKFM